MSLLSHSLNPQLLMHMRVFKGHIKKSLANSARAGLIILLSMSPEFQKQYKTVDAYSIVLHLREHYNKQTNSERFKVSKLLFGSKMEEWTSPVQYALKMYDHIERLDQLGYWMDFELRLGLILARLPNGFAQFMLDYGMEHIISNIPELIDVLKIA